MSKDPNTYKYQIFPMVSGLVFFIYQKQKLQDHNCNCYLMVFENLDSFMFSKELLVSMIFSIFLFHFCLKKFFLIYLWLCWGFIAARAFLQLWQWWWLAVQLLSCVQLLQPHGLQPSRLLCLWDSPGKNTGVGCQIGRAHV